MNVLLVDQFSDPGGAQLCLRDLLPGMLERGWRPQLMIPGEGMLFQAARELGVPAHRLPLTAYTCGRKTIRDVMRFAVDLPRAMGAVRRVVRDSNIDLVYVNGPRVLPAALGCGCPVVFHSHNLLGPGYARMLASAVIRRTGATVIAACHFLGDSLGGVVPKERVRVIYSGVPDQELEPRSRRIGSEFRVGLIGRISPEKGHLDFIEAARLIARQRKDVRFHVYGSALFSSADYEAQVRRMAEGLPIEFHGWINDVGLTLQGLDVMVVPSKAHDAAPRIVMEALAAGTPIVAYRSGGIPELFENGRSGTLCTASKPAALANAISGLLADSNQMAALASGGRQEWAKRFKVERYQQEICDLLQNVAHASDAISERWQRTARESARDAAIGSR